MDIAGNDTTDMRLSSPIRIPVETADCDCWRNEGEMVEWGNKIKELNSLIKNHEEEIEELKERVSRRNSQIAEMNDIIKNLASALSKLMIDDY